MAVEPQILGWEPGARGASPQGLAWVLHRRGVLLAPSRPEARAHVWQLPHAEDSCNQQPAGSSEGNAPHRRALILPRRPSAQGTASVGGTAGKGGTPAFGNDVLTGSKSPPQVMLQLVGL